MSNVNHQAGVGWGGQVAWGRGCVWGRHVRFPTGIMGIAGRQANGVGWVGKSGSQNGE